MAKYTNEQWIEQAKEKFGDRFSYKKTNYIDSYHKVTITCKEHNEDFLIDPITFIRKGVYKGNSCSKCKTNKKLTHEEFLEKAITNYGDMYDFSKVKYINAKTDVIITCPEHGEFSKRARDVSSNNKQILCSECAKFNSDVLRSQLKENEEAVFYKLLVTHKETKLQFIKIGITNYTSYQRYSYSEYKDFDFEVLEEIFDTSKNVFEMEKKYKLDNKHKRFYLPKYMKFSGHTECYIYGEKYQLKSSQVKFIRDGLLVKQNGKCKLCKHDVIMPTLDHYHSKRHNGSGLVRGVLCNTCNRFLGVVENNLTKNAIPFSDAPELLREMANYVENSRESFMHPTEVEKPKNVSKRQYNRLKKVYQDRAMFPEYPKSKKLTKKLEVLFKKYDISPFI